jgi:hypothetical protein
MRRSIGTVVLASALVGLVAVPAWGAVDRNPNAFQLIGVSCPEVGLHFETTWVASPSSLAGHDLDGNGVGVAKSLYVTTNEGEPVGTLWDRMGKGLKEITVWCYWEDGGSPTGYLGGDVLFNAHQRG